MNLTNRELIDTNYRRMRNRPKSPNRNLDKFPASSDFEYPCTELSTCMGNFLHSSSALAKIEEIEFILKNAKENENLKTHLTEEKDVGEEKIFKWVNAQKEEILKGLDEINEKLEQAEKLLDIWNSMTMDNV